MESGETFDPSQPLVSVVIPAFNASTFIERTLRSATRQTYPALEIIVVDDGSTDDTADLVKQSAMIDPRIRLLRTPNRGVSAARNTGIEASSGQFVAFLDADDLWHPTKIEKQIDALNGLSSQWAAVYVLHYVIDRDDEIIRPGASNIARGYIYARHLNFKYIGNGSALLVRRDAALEIGGFDSSYAAAGIGGCEDLDFELRLAARYWIEVVPERLVGYREYPGNMSSNHAQMGQGALEVIKRSLAANPQLPKYAAKSAVALTQKYAFRQYRKARNLRLTLASAWAILQDDPRFIFRFVWHSCLRLIKRRLNLKATTAQDEGPRLDRLRFDEQIVLSPIEGPEETIKSRRHLMRLTATDARLSSIRESAEGIASQVTKSEGSIAPNGRQAEHLL
ncbi:glycosyltransferase involved in cell wall biosynthesis [Rhizobium sp. BK529]|uniref:glycosyltransferase family 2 protein n=1 Tax=unclassified Rhizobium TaxID=2613769 RepID=UPI0010506D2A|nr:MULTISPECIES: glycosyltransferase family A protein [unclassified Rhizobium]MBB3595802.1 glycosyltransferase involved in cell wall biosynthesis [Rhizobium sp. BK529]TCR95173.1 glycosyl transferase family 2 [Rhizobium sp. BK418]